MKGEDKMKHILLGLLAHVDAGKTTLSERMFYVSGKLATLGRVDHQDAFLDYNTQEKNRGITIFSKQASFFWNQNEYTILDTPGHVDFSSEMESVLQVLDYAILIINGSNGVQAHTTTIWKLLKHYQIPVFIFVNKMDITYDTKDEIMDHLQSVLDEKCVDFTEEVSLYENIALCTDTLLKEYEDNASISLSSIQDAILNRTLFPCYFGSALKGTSIHSFLDMIDTYTKQKQYEDEFGAIVYKISHHDNLRLTHMKITGGTLHVKDTVLPDEKVDQIRIYDGDHYKSVDLVEAGRICVVKGLKEIQAQEVLGSARPLKKAMLEAYMNYHLCLPNNIDAYTMLKYLKILSDEDVQLHVTYHEKTGIQVRLMGEIQTEILKYMIQERFHIEVEFDEGEVLYKETIANIVEGVGHYEPLKHYAEVHLLLTPLARNSGIIIDSICNDEDLSPQWQKQVLSTLSNADLTGILTNSNLTDIKITLVSGKGHLKHTEGGDFREATLRALRQGLKETKMKLLEPYYDFEIHIQNDLLSKVIYDIEKMKGEYEIIASDSEDVIMKGNAPVSKMQNYQIQFSSHTKGKGYIHCQLRGYDTCINEEEVISKIGYECDSDLKNPSGSIFCVQGAGYYVSWDKVKEKMHLPSYLKEEKKHYERYDVKEVDEKELERIFERTYGPIKRRLPSQKKKNTNMNKEVSIMQDKPLCILVDGYNVIFAWESLKEIAKENLDSARDKLIHILSSYQGYKKCELILVFDAYKVKGGIGNKTYNDSIHVVYTKQAQTADTYIEKETHKLSDTFRVMVVTSDNMEQIIVSGQGAHIMSSREFEKEIKWMFKKGYQEFVDNSSKIGNRALEELRDMYFEED